jgi:hypothetical protein
MSLEWLIFPTSLLLLRERDDANMLHVNKHNLAATSYVTWGAVYTMDPELVPRLSEACDWMLNSSQEQISLHQAKNVREPIDIEVPKRQYQNPILSIDMVQRLFRWEGQKRWSRKNSQGPMAEKCQNKLIFFLFPS